jgi:hypothetical protein
MARHTLRRLEMMFDFIMLGEFDVAEEFLEKRHWVQALQPEPEGFGPAPEAGIGYGFASFFGVQVVSRA